MTSTNETNTLFSIGAEGFDSEAVVTSIRETVARKMREGVYADARIARAERHNLVNMSDSGELLKFYLNCLRDTVHVDINDFDIQDRRSGLSGKFLVTFKTSLWKILKFYTYRLWSQQNQINALTVTAVESSYQQMEKRVGELEARIRELEGKGSGEA